MLAKRKMRDNIAPTSCFGLENMMTALLIPVIIRLIKEGVG